MAKDLSEAQYGLFRQNKKKESKRYVTKEDIDNAIKEFKSMGGKIKKVEYVMPADQKMEYSPADHWLRDMMDKL